MVTVLPVVVAVVSVVEDFAHHVDAAGVVSAVGVVDVASDVHAFGVVLVFEVVTVETAFESLVSAADEDFFAAHMVYQDSAPNISAAACIFGPA